jgi:hypothetical protein
MIPFFVLSVIYCGPTGLCVDRSPAFPTFESWRECEEYRLRYVIYGRCMRETTARSLSSIQAQKETRL